MKKLFLIFSLCFAEFSYPQSDSLSQYHPLQNGNVWIYKNINYHLPVPADSYRISEVVGDTLLFVHSQIFFYKKIKSQIIGQTGFSYSFQRFDSTTGNFIVKNLDKNILEDSTFTSVPNSVFGGDYNINSRRLISSNNYSVLGLPTTIRNITENALIKEDQITWTYAFGIGLIGESDQDLQSSFDIYNYRIVYAKINGKEYGVDPQKKLMDSLVQYYPLQTGNTWIYTIGNTNTVEIHTIVKDTLMSNGKIYSVRVKENKDLINGAISNKIVSYERIDTSTVQIFSGYDTYEIRIDSLLAKKGDTTKSGTIKTIYIDNGSENILGTMRVFRTMKTPFPPFENIIRYSHGIGMTNRIENTYYDEYPFSLANSTNYGIVFAKVNGIEYGTNPLSVEDNNAILPTGFLLLQNYPNPFNPTTTILYQLPIDAYVSVKVYDAIGREVAVLANESEYAGTYKINFNASSLSSGLYFYRLRAGSFSQTNKMVLLR